MTEQARLDGILPINKPVGPTSHDMVDRVRRLLGQKQVGHAGTLDPLAEGLLLICLGKGTLLSQYLMASRKEYRAVISFGRSSPTFDREMVDLTILRRTLPELTAAKLEELLNSFRGEQCQRVPTYSAVKQRGTPLYALARAGEQVDAPSRLVTIHDLQLISYNEPELTIDVTCSSGTYIRSLAHEMGERLECGAYLSALTRTTSGKFNLKAAVNLEEADTPTGLRRVREQILPLSDALELPSLVLADDRLEDVRHGRPLYGDAIVEAVGHGLAGDPVAIRNRGGVLFALGKLTVDLAMVQEQHQTEVFRYGRVLA